MGKIRLSMSQENSSSSTGAGQLLRKGAQRYIQGDFRGRGVCVSVLVQELVVEDRGRQSESVFDIVGRVLDANQSSLAKYIAVLLSGD